MKEYIEQTVTNADNTPKVEKIKTPLAQIIVEQYHGKTYYNILWLDTKNWDFHIGYGSYNLEFVRKWLAEEFEIVEDAADVVEVVRCKCCEHCTWYTKMYELTGEQKIEYWCTNGKGRAVAVEPTHFCSYGERRSHQMLLCDQTEEGEHETD